MQGYLAGHNTWEIISFTFHIKEAISTRKKLSAILSSLEASSYEGLNSTLEF